MKALFGEYGKIIVTVIVLMVIMGFFFSSGYTNLIPEPVATTKSEDMTDAVDDIAGRARPVFNIQTTKLVKGQVYDMENKSVMKISALSADGTELPIDVTSLKFNDTEVDLSKVNTYEAQRGYTEVTYEITDNYRGTDLITTKTVRLVCN